jgi:hypothetical protein
VVTKEQLDEVGLKIVLTKKIWWLSDRQGRMLTSGRRCHRSDQRIMEIALEAASVKYVQLRMSGQLVKRPKVRTFKVMSDELLKAYSTRMMNHMKEQPFLVKFLGQTTDLHSREDGADK